MKFPFNEPENVAVFTCVHVLENKETVCYVTHDEDDGVWQFLCNRNHNLSDARVISLKEMVERDSSVCQLADMPLGYGVSREDGASPWKSFKK